MDIDKTIGFCRHVAAMSFAQSYITGRTIFIHEEVSVRTERVEGGQDLFKVKYASGHGNLEWQTNVFSEAVEYAAKKLQERG
jgi:hypothetical protein